MGKFSRDKGAREERAIVNKHKDNGFHALRIPLSGAARGFKGDVKIEGLTAECKERAGGFKTIYKWLSQDDTDLLTIKQTGKERLYVLPEALWFQIIKEGLPK